MKGQRFFLTISLIALTTLKSSAFAGTGVGGEKKLTEGTAMAKLTGGHYV
jgi:hypothetical protein